ncbi:MAG: aspartate carbamoyltransferase catalytic subunit [Planctomycetota bacterium]
MAETEPSAHLPTGQRPVAPQSGDLNSEPPHDEAPRSVPPRSDLPRSGAGGPDPSGSGDADLAAAGPPPTVPAAAAQASDPVGSAPSGPRHLVSIDDISIDEMSALFEHADRFAADPRGFADAAPGFISASLFYEPSTRTRLSFESAMLRLGGGVLTAAEMTSSSVVKGESLADTIRVVGGGYADVVVLRHPSEGAARLASMYSAVPVINAGDGSHEHPTQTLCDLYNLHVERGSIEGLDVVLAGDLKYSRTVHSFAYALARFKANIVCVPQPGLELPPYVVERLENEFGVNPVRADARRLGHLAADSDAVYLTPQKPHQLSLFTDAKGWEVAQVDAVYMTRPQTERYSEQDLSQTAYLRLEKRAMAAESLRDAVVMHPLPRRDEISPEVDADPRSIYFKQAARGVPIRMAILAWLLGRVDLGAASPRSARPTHPVPAGPNPCPNPSCISRTEARHVGPRIRLESARSDAARPERPRARCGYCTRVIQYEVVGCSSSRLFHAPEAPAVRQILPEHLVLFETPGAAEQHGFRAAMSAQPG